MESGRLKNPGWWGSPVPVASPQLRSSSGLQHVLAKCRVLALVRGVNDPLDLLLTKGELGIFRRSPRQIDGLGNFCFPTHLLTNALNS
jgi:hypothetical protein